MSFWYVAFVLACIVLFVAPLLLVFNDDYEDRFFGRLALLGTAFFAAIFLFEIFLGGGYHIEREEAGLLLSLALFMSWHIRVACKNIKARKAALALEA